MHNDLSRLQPVQQDHFPRNEKTAKNGGFLPPEAVVAGGRSKRGLRQSETATRTLGSSWQEALVAGAGFEPAAFRL